MKFFCAAILMGLFNLPLFGSDTKEVVFWRWFQTNQERLYAFDRDRERIFNDLSGAIKKVNPDLVYEFGPVRSDGRREFVVSAGGIRSAFPAVESLVSAAPKLDHWAFIPFRQRRSPLNDLSYSGRTVRAQDVNYMLFRDEDPKKVGVMLFFDDYSDREKAVFGQVGFLFLDQALGEYDVETRLGAVLFQGRDSKYVGRSQPLTGLSSAFDAYFKNR